jgi:hypothetical protein
VVAVKKNGIPQSDEAVREDAEGECFDPSKPLYNMRHERFAQLVFKGYKVRDAYIAAGFSETHGQGAWLTRNRQDVGARLNWLAEQAALETRRVEAKLRTKILYDQTQAMAEAEEARMLAMQLDRPSAAVAAVQTKAKIAGLLKEDLDLMMGARRPVREMSEKELQLLADEVATLIDTAKRPEQPTGPAVEADKAAPKPYH